MHLCQSVTLPFTCIVIEIGLQVQTILEKFAYPRIAAVRRFSAQLHTGLVKIAMIARNDAAQEIERGVARSVQ